MKPALAIGAPLVIVGLLLGPGLVVLDAASLRVLAPVTALALGWIGATFGSRLEWRVLRRIPRGAWIIAALQTGTTFVLTAAVVWLLARTLPALAAAWRPSPPALLAIAAIAAVSSPHAVALAAQRAGAGTRRADLLAINALLETVLGVGAFALVLAAYHPRAGFPGGFGWPAWLAVAAATSGAVGLLFLWLSRLRDDPGLELLGVLAVGSGLGYAVELSPFLVGALATALIVNRIPESRRRVQDLLRAWERPAYALLLVVAGAQLRLPTWWLVPAVVLLAVVRIGAHWISARSARLWLPAARLLPQLASGTVAQGGVAAALALSFGFVFQEAGGGVVLTTALLGVALARLAAPPLVTLAFRPARGEVSA